MTDLYHVTYAAFLDDIAEHGLVPGGQGGFRQGYWGDKGRGYVFLTERDGVFFWYGNLQQHAEHNSDNPYEAGLTPVVLRVRGLEEDELEDDPEGTRDGGAPSYKVPFGIDAVDIEVWDGQRWVFPERSAVDESQAWTPEEDEEGETLYWARSSYENLLEQPDYDAPWGTGFEQVPGGLRMVLPPRGVEKRHKMSDLGSPPAVHKREMVEAMQKATALARLADDDTGHTVVGEDNLEKLAQALFQLGRAYGAAQGAGQRDLAGVFEGISKLVFDKIHYHYAQGKKR